jgi:hypothetical protein
VLGLGWILGACKYRLFECNVYLIGLVAGNCLIALAGQEGHEKKIYLAESGHPARHELRADVSLSAVSKTLGH